MYSPRSSEDKELIKKHSKRKALVAGSNSTCRYHIRQHYEVYQERCEAAGVPEHHWAIPRNIMGATNLKAEKGGIGQKTLDTVFKKVTMPAGFTREGIREALAKFVVCDDQVSVKAERRTALTMVVPVTGRY